MFTRNCTVMFDEFKKSMMNEFEMTDLGMMHYFLGIEIVQSESGIFLSQKKYVGKILKIFHMHDCNSANTLVECGFKLCKDHDGKK
uniref:Copia protein n=1 Tax=Cajanus cajan TaxID=3821 RepID=A0A151SA13_CAJCA|nr:Copia protein [Cajanus cajan]